MCGLAGIFLLKNETKPEILSAESKRMIEVIRHRGPDGENFYSDEKLGLHFCRLAIIDLSENAKQPMRNEDGSIVFVCSGEIYNFKELQAMLIKKGHIFKSHCDSEVVGHLYEEFGQNFINELNGMFAIALWDIKKEKLILARDRFGIKPFYYTIVGTKLIFASEVKAILGCSFYKREPDFETIDFFFFSRRPFPNKTFFKNIFSLMPANMIVAEKERIRKIVYWEPYFSPIKIHSEKETIGEIRKLLFDSIKRALVVDAPLGLLLSGGVDSPLLLVSISKIFSKKIKTFSLGFEDGEGRLLNKEDFFRARQLAKYFKQEHYEYTISPKDILRYYHQMNEIFDEPIPFSNPLMFICEEAKKNVKVLLSGDGADEIFGGYADHLVAYDLLGRHKFKFEGVYMRELQYYLNKSMQYSSLFNQQEKEKIYISLALKNTLKDKRNKYEALLQKILNSSGTKDFINRRLFLDLKIHLPHPILNISEQISMHYSIENRVPYLEHRLVEFLSSLSGQFKIKNGVRKRILFKMLADLLPSRFMPSVKVKDVFSLPMKYGASSPFRKIAREVLSPTRLKKSGIFFDVKKSGIFDASAVDVKGLRQVSSLLTFQLWWERYFG